jgi:arsenite methyltransferase
MQNSEEIKEIVKEKYSELALANQSCGCSCCGTDQGATIDYTIMSDDYSKIDGYYSEADLGLGCGLPTENADIKEGNTVLDLGSGAGNDVFIARRSVGSNGRVIGIDFTDAMINKARVNCDKLGYNNVEFRKGDIEEMPIINNSIDVIVSNCVLNLVPDKNKAFSEMFRVLKPGGHFCVSDIVLNGELPDGLQNAAAMYTGCVAGASQMENYLKIIADSGFTDLSIPKKKKINIPDEILLSLISEEELDRFKVSGAEIVSVTVKANKPEKGEVPVCSCCG